MALPTPKTWMLWLLALVITLSAALYQRITGPTWPVSGKVSVRGAQIKFKLNRSHAGEGDEEIRLLVPEQVFGGTLELRRYPSRDPWSSVAMERDGDYLVGRIPHQPLAGKVMYRIELAGKDGTRTALTAEPVQVRFRGAVPASVMIPHIVVMFAAMLFSNRAGLDVLLSGERAYRLSLYTFIALVIGGLILGPAVQKYAFDSYWTGWPFGRDLTDNKTFLCATLWGLALWRTRRNPPARGWVLAAAVVTLAVFMIPHSVLGSELDYTAAPK
jgi:hypothetical protein